MLSIIKNNRKVLMDIALSIISSAVPIVILQLIILPLVSEELGDESYGLLITVMSYINVLPSAMGNVINNIRLIRNNDYIEKDCHGDFNCILVATIAINLFSLALFTVIYNFRFHFYIWFLLFVLSCLVSCYEYYCVAFRLTLNYKATLVCNVFLSVGYLLGYFAFCITGLWPLIYILGYFAGLLYILLKSNLWREPFSITVLFKDTVSKSVILFVAGLLSRLLNYADKLIIYPLIGASSVSIYYAASIIGKMVSMLISPISNVILSYISRMKRNQDKLFNAVIAIVMIIGVIGYFISLLLCKYILLLLYPQYLEAAIKLIPITTATAVVTAIIGVINPFVLKFVDVKFQIVINAITIVVYVLLATSLYRWADIMGFCFGVLVVNVLKCIILMLIYKCQTRKQTISM